MTAGDLVLYVKDPLLFGRLLIIEVTADNRLLCEALHAEPDGTYARETFAAHELELYERAQATA